MLAWCCPNLRPYSYERCCDTSGVLCHRCNLIHISIPGAGLLCHMLLVGGRMPYKILFARNSGKTFQVDFIPSYDQKGILERTEPVPFRLTRNLHTFFTPFGVEGVFVSAMAAAAQACP